MFSQGEVCRQMFYIEKGLVRIFYNSNSGKEITTWFSKENTFITSIDSFYQHKATQYNCELLEDSVIYSISYSDLETLIKNRHDVAILAFRISIEITQKMSEFMTSVKFQTAEERNKSMIQKYPSIFQRAALGHIASYLGITQETLSRVRAAKRFPKSILFDRNYAV